ncbi:MAG: sensor histidine kinase [Bacilli bacterium]
MLRKLRIKFVVVSVTAVSIILFSIVAFINITNYINVQERSNNILDTLIENDGRFPQGPDHKNKEDFGVETPFSTRFFTVRIDSNNNIISVNTEKISAVDYDKVKEYVEIILENDKEIGSVDDYEYEIKTKDSESLIVFIDNSRELDMFRSIRNTSILYSVIGIIGFCLLLIIFSKKAIKPITDSYEKQKQFITDASHELKTPLTVINSSTDVIEHNYGSDKWSAKIKNQVNKMSLLIEDLIVLTRLDESGNKFNRTEFDFSKLINDIVSDFSENRKFKIDMKDNIMVYASYDDINKLLHILIENAVKYSKDDKDIQIKVSKKGRKVLFSIYNYSDGLEKKDYSCLFERFYRLDSSRNSKTGGHGIGLSIASTIVENHRGKIRAYSNDGEQMILEFTL